MCIADFYFPHLGGLRWAAFVEYHPFAKWGSPFVPDSRAEISQVPVICQPAPPSSPPVTRAAVSPHSPTHPLSHPPLGETLCEATRCLLRCMSLFQTGSRCLIAFRVSGQSQETQCEGQTQVRLGVKNCGHMIHPVFRTSWVTSGYLWEQGNDLQGSGCGVSCYRVFSLVHMGCFLLCQMTTGDRPDLKIYFVFVCNIFVFFMTFFFLHGFAC